MVINSCAVWGRGGSCVSGSGGFVELICCVCGLQEGTVLRGSGGGTPPCPSESL